MAFPDDGLAPDEELLVHRHPHWKTLVAPTAYLLFVTFICAFLYGFVQARLSGGTGSAFGWAVLAIWFGLVVWLAVWPTVSWRFTHFVVTDRRVMFRHGVLTTQGIDIPLGRISNVQFYHDFIDRLLRTGKLIVTSSAQDPLEFDNIPNVERVHNLLYLQVFDAMQLEDDELEAIESQDQK